jgi:hypothetical protein
MARKPEAAGGGWVEAEITPLAPQGGDPNCNTSLPEKQWKLATLDK